MVAGIHCRGEDLAVFPLRRFSPTTFVYIGMRMQCRSVDFTTCGFVHLAIFERRVPDFMTLFTFTSVGEFKVKEPTTVK